MRLASPSLTVFARSPLKKLTVIIPCFNERNTILEIIARVKSLPIDLAIIVVDNCSTDGTRELLRAACSEEISSISLRERGAVVPGQVVLRGDGFVTILQPRNMEKGTSVRTGLAMAESEYVICQDADLEYDPRDIVRLLRFAEERGAAAVFGSRLAGQNLMDWNAFQFGRVALSRLFTVLYGAPITDVATCYKLVRTEVLRSLPLHSSGFDLDFEIPARLRLKNHEIYELPIEYRPRTTEQGKKIRWRDGLSAAWVMLRTRLS